MTTPEFTAERLEFEQANPVPMHVCWNGALRMYLPISCAWKVRRVRADAGVAADHHNLRLDGWRSCARRQKEEIEALRKDAGWQSMETAPKNRSVMLWAGEHTPVYIGKERYGTLGEPAQTVYAWRCDSSGCFANPTLWRELPAPPLN